MTTNEDCGKYLLQGHGPFDQEWRRGLGIDDIGCSWFSLWTLDRRERGLLARLERQCLDEQGWSSQSDVRRFLENGKLSDHIS